MKYLKKIENYLIGENDHKSSSITLTTEEIFNYLGLNIYDHENHNKSIYDIDTQKFIEEIFLDKDVEFTSLDKINGNKDIKCKTEKVCLWYYKELYIMIFNNDWQIINPNSIIRIFNYDAEDKPLHKEIKIKQKAHKYNL